MTLQQLHYIIEIAKNGSITAAAERLFISQPSLSKAVKEMEQELGILILKRSRHGIAFTAQGLELLSYAYRVTEQMDGLYSHFLGEEETSSLALSISSQHYMFPTDALQQMITSLDESITSYAITLREGYTSEVIEDVLTQRSQIGILYLSHGNERFLTRLFHQKGIVFTPLGEYTPQIYIRKGHPLSSRASVSIHELKKYPYIQYDQRSDSEQYSEEIVFADKVSTKQIFVTDRSGMLSVIRTTDAFNIGTGCICPDMVGEDIISIPISGCFDTMTIGRIHLRNAILDEAVQQYIACLDEALRRCHPV